MRSWLLAAPAMLGKDEAAAFGLRPEQEEILVMRIARLGVAHQLLGHNRDGRKRRAQSVRRRRGKAIERREFLLAREHHLGRGQGLGHAPRLLCRAPGIEADEENAGTTAAHTPSHRERGATG